MLYIKHHGDDAAYAMPLLSCSAVLALNVYVEQVSLFIHTKTASVIHIM